MINVGAHFFTTRDMRYLVSKQQTVGSPLVYVPRSSKMKIHCIQMFLRLTVMLITSFKVLSFFTTTNGNLPSQKMPSPQNSISFITGGYLETEMRNFFLHLISKPSRGSEIVKCSLVLIQGCDVGALTANL